jgi:hypothetical protein
VSALPRLEPFWRSLFGEADLVTQRVSQQPLHIDRDGGDGSLGHGRRGAVDEEQHG